MPGAASIKRFKIARLTTVTWACALLNAKAMPIVWPQPGVTIKPVGQILLRAKHALWTSSAPMAIAPVEFAVSKLAVGILPAARMAFVYSLVAHRPIAFLGIGVTLGSNACETTKTCASQGPDVVAGW